MDPRKMPGYQEQRKILQRVQILNPKLTPHVTIGFIEYIDLVNRRFRKKNNKAQDKTAIVTMVMHILKREHPDKTLIYTIKKCAFIHAFAHQAALTSSFNAALAEQLMVYLNQVINEGVVAEFNPNNSQRKNQLTKRQGSMSRLYNAIRSLSSSKEKQRSNSKLKVEISSDKGALNEIVLKIINPFCVYLMKIVQDPSVYSYIVARDLEKDSWEEIKWKIHNLLKSLGKLVLELNRIGKYYKDDMMGLWVLVYYVMSTDIAVYYNILVSELSQRSERWKDKINMALKIGKINRKYTRELQEILSDAKFVELKSELQMITELKQTFFYLYYNVQMQKWVHIMAVPFQSGEKRRKMEPIEYILDFYERYGHRLVRHKQQEESKLSHKPKNGQVKRSTSESSLQGMIKRLPILQRAGIEEQKQPKTNSSTIRRNNFLSKKQI